MTIGGGGGFNLFLNTWGFISNDISRKHITNVTKDRLFISHLSKFSRYVHRSRLEKYSFQEDTGTCITVKLKTQDKGLLY